MGWGYGFKKRVSATRLTNGTRKDGSFISIFIKCILYGSSSISLVDTTLESNYIGSQTCIQPWSRTKDPTTNLYMYVDKLLDFDIIFKLMLPLFPFFMFPFLLNFLSSLLR